MGFAYFMIAVCTGEIAACIYCKVQNDKIGKSLEARKLTKAKKSASSS